MPVAQLSIDMVAKVAEFEKDLKRATTATERQTSIMANALKGLGAAFSVGFVIDFAKRTIDSVDALNDLADATGASIENISALEDIAARTGTSMEGVTTALVKFNGVLKDVKPGSDSEKAFKLLNLDVAELKRLDPAEALLKTATAFAGFADDGKKARITQELFGKSLKEVAPFLKDLADKGELVAKVTTQQAQEAEKFNKQLFEFQKNSQDASRAITSTLLPSLIKINEEIATGIKISGGLFNAILTIGSTNPFNSMAENLIQYRKELEDLKAQKSNMSPLQAMVEGPRVDAAIKKTEQRIAYFKKLQANEALFSSEQSDAESRRLGLATGIKPSLDDLGNGGNGSKPKAEQISEDSRALAAYVEGLQKVLEKNDNLTEQEKTLNFLRTIGATGEITQVRELTLVMAQQVDKMKAEEIAQKAINTAREQSIRSIETLANSSAAVDITNQALREHMEEIGLTTEQLNKLTLARMDAKIAQEQEIITMVSAHGASVEEIALMQLKIDKLKEQRTLTEQGQYKQIDADVKRKLEDASKDYSVTLHNDVKGALIAAFRDSKDPVAAFGDALAETIFVRVTESMAEAMASQLVFSLLGGGSGMGGSIFSFDGGGTTGSSPRIGGLDGKGGFMALLHPQETVIDHTKSRPIRATSDTGANQPGDSYTININAVVGDVASKSDVVNGMRTTATQIQAAIMRSRTHGGALS